MANRPLLRNQCKKTSQFKTHCKGDIHVSHAFETAKITVFYPTACKTPDVPLQNELILVPIESLYATSY